MILSMQYSNEKQDEIDGTGIIVHEIYRVDFTMKSTSEEEANQVINGIIKQLGEKLKIGE
jgi:hypothetical protein